MIYIYDILINFTSSSRVYEVFEWDKRDNIEHIKRIPLFFVNYDLIDNLLNDNVSVSKTFLETIKDKTIVFKDTIDTKIKYCALLTEGSRVYAFKFKEEGNVEYKSSLLLDEEEEVLELSYQLNDYKIDYIVNKKVLNQTYLTRSAEKNKMYILKDLKYTYERKNYSKLKYLYNECYGEDKTTNKYKYERLISSLDTINSPVRNKLNYILKMSYNSTCK